MDDRFAVEALLAPLGDEADGNGAAGADVRGGGSAASSLYLAVKDSRAEARLAERDALASGDPAAVPLLAGWRAWQEVAEGAVRLLSESKDLQVAAWLVEAWLRTDGFPGVAAGFELLAGLVERFWDYGLYPGEDEDGVETRVVPLFGLFGNSDVGTLLQPLKLLPLTDYAPPTVALWTIEAVRAQSTRHDDPDVAEELAERRQTQIATMEGAIGRASPSFAADATAGIASALHALDRLMAAIDARTPFGRFGSQVVRPLEDAATLMRVHGVRAPEVTADEPAEQEIELGDAQESAALAPRGTPRTAPMNRERALATLLEVAAFFERNEPQSLVAESLRSVVRRANLSAEALLAELLPDSQQRALFLLRAGIGQGQDQVTATDY